MMMAGDERPEGIRFGNNAGEVSTSVGLPFHFLYAASLHVSVSATEIQTVLGSCVSVCLFDRVKCFGGMNHYMLPAWTGGGVRSVKHGDVAIEALLEKMLAFGARKKDLVAKIFGGADTFGEQGIYGIGKRNVSQAEDQLATYRIPVIGSNVGGAVGRKILFHSASGRVYMKFINQPEIKDELQY